MKHPIIKVLKSKILRNFIKKSIRKSIYGPKPFSRKTGILWRILSSIGNAFLVNSYIGKIDTILIWKFDDTSNWSFLRKWVSYKEKHTQYMNDWNRSRNTPKTPRPAIYLQLSLSPWSYFSKGWEEKEGVQAPWHFTAPSVVQLPYMVFWVGNPLPMYAWWDSAIVR